MTDSFCDMPLADVAAIVRRGEVSPVELTQEALGRIERFNPLLNAFWTVTAESAMQQAREAENEIVKGEYRGPLHGLPIALKDLFYTRGIRTTSGSKIFAGFIPDYDATVVRKLRDAGAVLLGKTALHEFAYGVTNDNPHFGPTRNPWDTTRVSGGSSGGSAVAVATGMSFAALGTDTGGSIRIPASFCGVAGLKPTFGRVSLHGVYPLGYTLDHVGPLTRTVVDAGIVYQSIAGFDPLDAHSVDRPLGEIALRKSLDGVRIGVPKAFFFDALEPEVNRLVRAAFPVLEQCGARLLQVSLPDMARLDELGRFLLSAEAYTLHREHLESRADDLGEDVRRLIEGGREISAADYIAGQLERARLSRDFEQVFEQVDAIVTPTTPLVAFPIGDTEETLGGEKQSARKATTRLVRPLDTTGHPALSVCCGFTDLGLPVGLQFVSRLWNETVLLRVGYAYEQATGWHLRRPPL